MLAAISAAGGEAEQTASTALDGLELEESLAPIRKGARIIKEISWRWREIGADGRICGPPWTPQVGAIEAGCDDIAGVDPRVGAARGLRHDQSERLRPCPNIAEATPAGVEGVTPPAEAALLDIAAAVDEPVAMAESVEAPPDDAEAYDEAMLDMVALEMAAPDFDDADTEFAITAPEAHLDEPPQVPIAEPPRVQASEPQQAQAVEPSQGDYVAGPRSVRRSPRRRLRLSPRRSLGGRIILASGLQ